MRFYKTDVYIFYYRKPCTRESRRLGNPVMFLSLRVLQAPGLNSVQPRGFNAGFVEGKFTISSLKRKSGGVLK